MRRCGPHEPAIAQLVSNAYAGEWVAKHSRRADALAPAARIAPRSTAAARGHALGARQQLQGPQPASEWKMQRFAKATSKVAALRGGGDAPAC